MNDKQRPLPDDEHEENEHTEGVVAADATGMVANEIFLTQVELLEAQEHPDRAHERT